MAKSVIFNSTKGTEATKAEAAAKAYLKGIKSGEYRETTKVTIEQLYNGDCMLWDTEDAQVILILGVVETSKG